MVYVSSCSKNFLDVNDNSFLNKQSYVKDLQSMQEYLNGVYVMIGEGYSFSYSIAYPELTADNLKITSPTSQLKLHYNWSQLPDASTIGFATAMNGSWQSFYQIIRSSNFIIENVDKYSKENSTRTNSIKGQALAIRALIHFRLANIFAQPYSFSKDASHLNVPYITVSDITKSYTRQTTTEVYKNIITDLKESIPLLPSTFTDCRSLNSSAAKALLAIVYLYMEDYSNAKQNALEITDKVSLMTISGGYPENLFKNIAPSQTEILFQTTPTSNNLIGYSLRDRYSYVASNDIGAILKEHPSDVRSQWVKDTLAGDLKVVKFPTGVAGGLVYHPSSDYYTPIIRASEIYLVAAEASAKTGNENIARTYLNAIRKRADPLTNEITPTGQALLDSIYKEKRKELCFEGSRLFDLRRLKMEVRRIDVFPGTQTNLPYPSEKAIAPIPGQDVKLMGLIQNPGY